MGALVIVLNLENYVMTYKQQIEQDAIREARALQKQGRAEHRRHCREAKTYSADRFEKLFKK